MGILGTQQKNAELVQKKLVELCAYISIDRSGNVGIGTGYPKQTNVRVNQQLEANAYRQQWKLVGRSHKKTRENRG
jgi:predicted metal-dependent phosphotriesterase family hydrolase